MRHHILKIDFLNENANSHYYIRWVKALEDCLNIADWAGSGNCF